MAATRVEGAHFVGGVIGANMPVGSFTVQDTLGKAGALTTTVTAGRVRADGVAGGIIGYNRLLAALPQDVTPCGHAAHLQRRQCADRQHGRDQQRRSGLP